MKLLCFSFFSLIFIFSCDISSDQKEENPNIKKEKFDSVNIQNVLDTTENRISIYDKYKDDFTLTEENALPFLENYHKTLPNKTKVKMTTDMGSFVVELYDDVIYHKANFVYLAKRNYFDSTVFHRVVRNFIIQGGNTDSYKKGYERLLIGRYLLPLDAKEKYKHNRGVISMPSSDIENPHDLAPPYEFFIVVDRRGAHHLDGEYTPFGRVVSGMNVVDKINKVEVGQGDWPVKEVYILGAEVL